MNPVFAAYAALGGAIIFEVMGSTLLQKSDQFTKVLPTIGMAVSFLAAFFFLSLALKAMPLGVAYAIWAGLGVVLTTLVGVFVFRFAIDGWGIVGIGLIVSGVVVMNVLSKTATH